MGEIFYIDSKEPLMLQLIPIWHIIMINGYKGKHFLKEAFQSIPHGKVIYQYKFVCENLEVMKEGRKRIKYWSQKVFKGQYYRRKNWIGTKTLLIISENFGINQI